MRGGVGSVLLGFWVFGLRGSKVVPETECCWGRFALGVVQN